VDPAEFPGVVKRDCIVLDFGTSSQMHGCLEQDVNLDLQPGTGEAPTKTCPCCEAEVPISVTECPICGHAFEGGGPAAAPLSDFVMTEIDLLRRSSFQWRDLFGDDAALMAGGFTAWSGAFLLEGDWHAVGGGKGLPTRLLAVGGRLVALAAADDWLNEHETDESAHKTKR
jgi:DNA repair protein RadD